MNWLGELPPELHLCTQERRRRIASASARNRITSLWVEEVEGDFSLEVRAIAAGL